MPREGRQHVSVTENSTDTDRGHVVTTAFREHRSTVYSIACRIVGGDAAGDVTQNVFLRLWRRPEAYDPARGPLKVYLSVLCRGMSVDYLRLQSSTRDRDDRLAVRDEYEDDVALKRIVTAHANERVRCELARIEAGHRDALVLAFYQGLSYREVALRLGIPEGTAKSRIRRALTDLRAALSDLVPPASSIGSP